MVNQIRRQIIDWAVIPRLGIMLLVSAMFVAPIAHAQNQEIEQELSNSNGSPQNILPDEPSAVQSEVQEASIERSLSKINALEKKLSTDDYSEYEYPTSTLLGDGEFEDLILAVFVDKKVLSAGVFAVQKREGYYLPIAALSEVFNFNVNTDLENRSVDGWAISAERAFSIDAQNNRIQYRGETAVLPPGSVLEEDIASDDIYVLSDILTQIWPLSLDVDLGSLVLRVVPDEDLPFQKLLDRKARQDKLLKDQEKRELEDVRNLPFIAQPYKLFGLPSFDFSTQAGYNSRLDSPEYRMNFNGVQDLAFASADYSLGFGQVDGKFDRPENFRLRFRRQDIHENALPFGLEDVQWGDIRLKNRSLIASGLGGRGATFTTREEIFDSEFDVITVDGIGTPGWETELYINDQLIDFGVVDERGEYRFEDVSVGYGNNRIRVALYGPQGQLKERKENYFYQSRMVAAGENEFSGGIVNAERDLIQLEERRTNRPEGIGANLYGARGISDKLTVFASASRIRDRDDDPTAQAGQVDVTRKYVTAGAIGTAMGTLAQLEFYKELDAGHAVDVRTLSDFKGFKFNTRLSKFNNFESQSAKNGGSAKDVEAEFSVRKIFSTFIGSLGLEAGVDYLKRKNNTRSKSYTTRQSLGLKGTRVTHLTRSTLTNGSHATTTGRLSSSTRFNQWRWRNSMNYRYFPDSGLTSLETELRYSKKKNSTAFRLQRNVVSDETIAGFQITRDFKKFLGSVEADWSSIHGASLMFRASASVGPYNPDGSYLMQSDPLRTAGPISAFVYLDKDNDGIYNGEDEPVPNTNIAVGRRIIKEETDENGYIAEVNRASVGRATNVRVSQRSIDDPYLVPSVKGYAVHPRPGVIHALHLPLIETGAIDGTVTLTDGKSASGQEIELVDVYNDVIQKTRTAVDGYFTFERIPPGDYTIRTAIDSEMNVSERNVSLTPDNLFQFGIDLDATDELTGDGSQSLTIKNILSVARNFKEAGSRVFKTASASPQVMARNNITGSAIVQDVRIGNHPGKVRVVLDLTGPTNYSLNHDPARGIVSIQLPQASWSTKTNWQNKPGRIVRNYTVQGLGSAGNSLSLAVADGVKIGASGLLKASGSKKDRLYVDIERN